jgi:hypothetical protein
VVVVLLAAPEFQQLVLVVGLLVCRMGLTQYLEVVDQVRKLQEEPVQFNQVSRAVVALVKLHPVQGQAVLVAVAEK